VKCELIADNIHVHPAMMRLLFMLKGHEGVILITDSVRAAGMPEGDYRMDERTIMVKDGAVRLSDGTLAGSILTLNRALHNYIQATEQPLEYVWQASSLNAAHAIGIDSRKGSLEVGKDADLVLVNRDIEVYMTIADGRIVYRKDAF
jgi:N-acetylglucosamine-6-phosphate deacetylase